MKKLNKIKREIINMLKGLDELLKDILYIIILNKKNNFLFK